MSGIPVPSAFEPVVLPGSNNRDMTDQICGLATRSEAFLWWWIAIAPCAALTCLLLACIVWLFGQGGGIWGIDWPVSPLSYVWWIAIANGGTFISALFYLTRSEWRSSINRLAELAANLQPLAVGFIRHHDLRRNCSPGW